MIARAALQQRASEWGLTEEVVEKDYVLGWLLSGIGSHPRLRDHWIFKGGTCLKKCFVETYRFSEALAGVGRTGSLLGQPRPTDRLAWRELSRAPCRIPACSRSYEPRVAGASAGSNDETDGGAYRTASNRSTPSPSGVAVIRPSPTIRSVWPTTSLSVKNVRVAAMSPHSACASSYAVRGCSAISP